MNLALSRLLGKGVIRELERDKKREGKLNLLTLRFYLLLFCSFLRLVVFLKANLRFGILAHVYLGFLLSPHPIFYSRAELSFT